MNSKYLKVNLDYSFEDPGPSNFFFFLSDQYSFIQYGIPVVWLSSEGEPQKDLHRPTDTPERVNYEKVKIITKLAYLIAFEIGNKDKMLPLDLNPDITTRGKHNLKFDWRKEIESRPTR